MKLGSKVLRTAYVAPAAPAASAAR
jgi:hypothetical protein